MCGFILDKNRQHENLEVCVQCTCLWTSCQRATCQKGNGQCVCVWSLWCWQWHAREVAANVFRRGQRADSCVPSLFIILCRGCFSAAEHPRTHAGTQRVGVLSVVGRVEASPHQGCFQFKRFRVCVVSVVPSPSSPCCQQSRSQWARHASVKQQAVLSVTAWAWFLVGSSICKLKGGVRGVVRAPLPQEAKPDIMAWISELRVVWTRLQAGGGLFWRALRIVGNGKPDRECSLLQTQPGQSSRGSAGKNVRIFPKSKYTTFVPLGLLETLVAPMF